MQNSGFRTRLTSVYWSQTSSVVLSTHNSVLSTIIKSQYGFQPSPVVLCMQTATLALELLVSIVPCPHLRFLHANQRPLDENNKSLWVPALICVFLSCKTATLWPDLQVCEGPRPHLWFWAHITACLAQEWKDNMGSSPHLWFCACKQRL